MAKYSTVQHNQSSVFIPPADMWAALPGVPTNAVQTLQAT